MNWIEIKVVYTHQRKKLAGDLIADSFYNIGVKGVVIGDPDLKPCHGRSQHYVSPPRQASVTGYLPDNDRFSERFVELQQQLKLLESEQQILSDIYSRRVAEEDWSESWKAFFKPERIADHVVVKPTWARFSAKPDDIVIHIDPGMAFGTGTHATTALCIQMIQTYLKQDDTFLDVGSGSGILMVAAALFGARFVYGIDSDEVAIEVAQRNVAINKIDDEKVSLRCGDLLDGLDESFDFVVANILSEVILRLLDDLDRVLNRGGYFVCSGIFEDRSKLVLDKIKATGLSCVDLGRRDQWMCIVARKD